MSLIGRIKSALSAALVTASLWASPAIAAGTTPLSLVQQFDSTGSPLAGCLLYFYVAGTVASPQNAYADFGLTTALPNPLQCDQSGRVPQHWLADGLIHIRLTDSSGVQIIDTTMQVLGPSSGGGGGGGTIDPTTIASTGDMKWRLDKTPQTGWVRINGLTIGSATSGATERANADTQALFVYIWTTFSQPSGNVICPVVGGLGASALADFNANKKITLEDGRARSLFALDDMGNAALGGFTGVAFSLGNATTGGAAAGANSTTLTTLNLPPYTPEGGVSPSGVFQALNGGGGALLDFYVPSASGTGTSSAGLSASFAGVPQGGTSTPFPAVPKALLGTLFWKL